jgi:hypothetical protein
MLAVLFSVLISRVVNFGVDVFGSDEDSVVNFGVVLKVLFSVLGRFGVVLKVLFSVLGKFGVDVFGSDEVCVLGS